MGRTTIILAVSLAALAIHSFIGCTKADMEVVRVAVAAPWPPMEMINRRGGVEGFDIDLMKAIAKKSGFAVEFENTAWYGIFVGLAAYKYDAVISSVTITEERKKTMDFSDPYVNAGQVLIVTADTQDVTVLADLKEKSVGAQIGTTGAFEVEKASGVSLMSYEELGFAIEDLVAGRIAGVVADSLIAADYALHKTDYSNKLKIVGEPFTDEKYGIAVRKGNKELLDKINAGLSAVKEAGILEKLAKKWLR
jgi:polar amino acid transport system substrate-binding protein